MGGDRGARRYLVTGGAGFIGSHIVEELLLRGHDVVVLDDLSTGRRANLEDVEASVEASAPGSLEFIEASLLDEDALDRAVGGGPAQAVFHQAALASVPRSFADPMATLRVNVEGTAALLEACRRHGVRRVAYASSSSIYGDTPTLPKEESMPLHPLSPYAVSKSTDEELAAIWARQYDFEIVGLRYFNVFGPRQDPASEYAAVIPRFITRMLDGEPPIVFGDGEQSRDFTFIANAVEANLLAAGVADPSDPPGRPAIDWDEAAGQAVNVGVGDRFTLLELVDALNEILGTDLEPIFQDPRPGDVRHSMAAVDRARDLIGYRPRVSFREGLERTVNWFRDRR